MASSAGKRERERQKLEKAQLKAERKAARQEAQDETDDVTVNRTEAELIDDLASLQRSFEAGEVSSDDFTARREQIQADLERILR